MAMPTSVSLKPTPETEKEEELLKLASSPNSHNLIILVIL